MSNYTRTITRSFTFEKDTITVEMTRLTKAAFRRLGEYLEVVDGIPTGKISFKNQLDMLLEASELLPAHVVKITGLADAEGQPLGIEDIADQQYFVDLTADIFKELMEASVVQDPKASAGKSGVSSKESPAEVPELEAVR